MVAVVQKDICTGCELCPEIGPDIFEMDSDGKAHAKVDEIATEQEGKATQAAESCPVNAIKLVKKKFETI